MYDINILFKVLCIAFFPICVLPALNKTLNIITDPSITTASRREVPRSISNHYCVKNGISLVLQIEKKDVFKDRIQFL